MKAIVSPRRPVEMLLAMAQGSSAACRPLRQVETRAPARLAYLTAGALILGFAFAVPASAAIDGCIKSYRAFEAGHRDLVDVESGCGEAAQRDVKIAQVLLARAHYRARHYRQALPWLLRAAYAGDHVAPFLVAAVYHHVDQRERSLAWAARAARSLEQARREATGAMRAYLDRTMAEVHELVGPQIDDWIREGRTRAPAAGGNRVETLFGKWRIGPNSNCATAYTWIGADGASSYLAGRELAYRRVTIDETGGRVTLFSGQGSLTLVRVDADTLKVVASTQWGSRQSLGGAVLATRCI